MLKKAYLKRIQTIHPDKFFNSRNEARNEHSNTLQPNESSHNGKITYFIELQEAWKAYEQYYKHMKQSTNENGEGNFTMFGVGCSFSDNPVERERRNEIMNQACKGWFAAGILPEKDDVSDIKSREQMPSQETTPKLLLDEDLFVPVKNDNNQRNCAIAKRSLVEHLRISHTKSP
jgi:hypothetical protein